MPNASPRKKTDVGVDVGWNCITPKKCDKVMRIGFVVASPDKTGNNCGRGQGSTDQANMFRRSVIGGAQRHFIQWLAFASYDDTKASRTISEGKEITILLLITSF